MPNNTTKITHSGFVGLVGRPNVGKSTLLNCLSQKKVSIVSNKQQTTRGIVRSVVNHYGVQMVWLDTPGWQNRHLDAFNQNLNRSVEQTTYAVDVIALMTAAGTWTDSDTQIIKRLPKDKPVIALINKTDTLANRDWVLRDIDALAQRHDFAAIIPISARKKQGIDAVIETVGEQIPSSPQPLWTDVDNTVDTNFFFAELVREAAFRYLSDELPYALGVVVESENVARILRASITIYVEKESQKRIVIGTGGEQLKRILSDARRAMQAHIRRRIDAQTHVVVRRWRQDANLLRQMRLLPA